MADDNYSQPTFSDLTAEEQLNELKRLENEAIVAAGLREPVTQYEPPAPMITDVAPEAAAPIPSPVGIQPPAAPLNLPVSAGRMYMGPMLSAQEEAAFRASPTPTSVNLVPPPTAPPPTELERLRSSDLPGSRTLSIRRDVQMPVPTNPAELPAFALSEYQRMKAAGLPDPEARSRSGIDVVGSRFGRYGPMSEFQRESLLRRDEDQKIREAAQKLREQEQAIKTEEAWKSDPDYKATVDRQKEIKKNIDLMDAIPKLTPKQEQKRADLIKEGVDILEEQTRIKKRYTDKYKVTKIK